MGATLSVAEQANIPIDGGDGCWLECLLSTMGSGLPSGHTKETIVLNLKILLSQMSRSRRGGHAAGATLHTYLRRQQYVCIVGRACVCMRYTLSVCINRLHPAACLMQWTGEKRHSSPMASDELSYYVISPFVPDISQTELSVQKQPDVLSF